MPYGIYNAMKSAIPIDKAGRLILPQQVRRQFHIAAGDWLDMEVVSDGIFLRAHSRQADLMEENGLLVHEGEAVGDLAQIVEGIRTDRDAELLGLRQ
jgi:AbrB family looped-hinge helix DNA binding protein